MTRRLLLAALVITLAALVLLLAPFLGPKPICRGPKKQSYGRGPWMYVVCSATPWTPGVVWTENDGLAWWRYYPQ